MSPTSLSAAEMVATMAISSLPSTSRDCLPIGVDGRGDGLLDAALERHRVARRRPRCACPRLTIAWASTVAVVVPSPATSLVLVATSFASWAPMFSYGSSSSTSLAMVTPSLVIVGAPHFLSRTTLRPFGPSVTATASASLSTPASSAAPGFLVELQLLRSHGTSVPLRYRRRARRGRSRTRYSSPSTLTSVPPYLE